MTESHDHLVVLFSANEPYEAQAVQNALAAEGIESRVEGDHLMMALGSLARASSVGPRVVVREQDEPQARMLLQRWLTDIQKKRERASQSPSQETATCLACGASMNHSSTCPACGWSYRSG